MKSMIKKMLKVTVALVCMGGIYLFTRSSQSQPLTDLTKANIEALAQGEESNGNYKCYGSGNVECNGSFVQYKISGYHLK
jgi:hypothetical protein